MSQPKTPLPSHHAGAHRMTPPHSPRPAIHIKPSLGREKNHRIHIPTVVIAVFASSNAILICQCTPVTDWDDMLNRQAARAKTTITTAMILRLGQSFPQLATVGGFATAPPLILFAATLKVSLCPHNPKLPCPATTPAVTGQ